MKTTADMNSSRIQKIEIFYYSISACSGNIWRYSLGDYEDRANLVGYNGP